MTISCFALRSIVAIVALVISSACGNSPTGPTPTPVPPVGNPPPFLNVIKIEEISPTSGSTLPYTDTLQDARGRITYSWDFDPNIPGRTGVQALYSADCITVFPGVVMIPSQTSGMTSVQPGMSRSSNTKQINCVIARIVRVDENFGIISVVAETIKPWVFNFQ